MDVPHHLTAKQLKDILISVYNKGNKKQDVQVIDMVNEMKQSILTVYGYTLKK